MLILLSLLGLLLSVSTRPSTPSLVHLEDVLYPLLLHMHITYSVPFSVTAELTVGTGDEQGLCSGVCFFAVCFSCYSRLRVSAHV